MTKRPEDYFAEMVKTDDHMRKVKNKSLPGSPFYFCKNNWRERLMYIYPCPLRRFTFAFQKKARG